MPLNTTTARWLRAQSIASPYVFAIHALNPDDYVISTYRDHGHFLARGGDPKAFMAELGMEGEIVWCESNRCCFYQGKIWTGLLFLACSGVVITFPLAAPILFIGILYDFLTLNEQLSEVNRGK